MSAGCASSCVPLPRHRSHSRVTSFRVGNTGEVLMNVTRTSAAAFTVSFESEEELREEHRVNLAHGALRLPTTETVALNTTLLITLRGPRGGEAFARATAVAMLPDGIALSVDGNPDEQLARLLVGGQESGVGDLDVSAKPPTSLIPDSRPHGVEEDTSEKQ